MYHVHPINGSDTQLRNAESAFGLKGEMQDRNGKIQYALNRSR